MILFQATRWLERLIFCWLEDNPPDVELVECIFKQSNMRAKVKTAGDGMEAMAFLRKQNGYHDVSLPDFILLELNLPKKDGFEVLKEIKTDQHLKRIPVIVLTNSEATEDIRRAYDLHANCYANKGMDLRIFFPQLKMIHDFWGTIVKLPADCQNDCLSTAEI